jgi:hypothetical protein
MKQRPLQLLMTSLFALSMAACSEPAPPANNAALAQSDLAPLISQPVRIGSEGITLPACPSVSRVKEEGTNVYWAPDETRAIKAKLGGNARVALCEATDGDAWFGVVFPAPGLDMDMCRVNTAVASVREYQGPCRWGWIKGGTVRLGV